MTLASATPLRDSPERGSEHRLGRSHAVDVGSTFENPVTGERFVMRATAASTGGQYCEFDLHVAPGAKVAAPHRHPGQLETFSLLSGVLDMAVAGQRRRVEAGEDVAVPIGVPHTWGNTPPRNRRTRWSG